MNGMRSKILMSLYKKRHYGVRRGENRNELELKYDMIVRYTHSDEQTGRIKDTIRK